MLLPAWHPPPAHLMRSLSRPSSRSCSSILEAARCVCFANSSCSGRRSTGQQCLRTGSEEQPLPTHCCCGHPSCSRDTAGGLTGTTGSQKHRSVPASAPALRWRHPRAAAPLPGQPPAGATEPQSDPVSAEPEPAPRTAATMQAARLSYQVLLCRCYTLSPNCGANRLVDQDLPLTTLQIQPVHTLKYCCCSCTGRLACCLEEASMAATSVLYCCCNSLTRSCTRQQRSGITHFS